MPPWVPRRPGHAERGDHTGAHPHASTGIGQPDQKRYWAEMPRKGLRPKTGPSLIFSNFHIFIFQFKISIKLCNFLKYKENGIQLGKYEISFYRIFKSISVQRT
jgi:hypothetical protein